MGPSLWASRCKLHPNLRSVGEGEGRHLVIRQLFVWQLTWVLGGFGCKGAMDGEGMGGSQGENEACLGVWIFLSCP